VSVTYPAYLVALGETPHKAAIVAHVDAYIMEAHALKARIAQLESALREAIEYIRLDEEYSDWAAPWNITKWESLVAAEPAKGRDCDCGATEYPPNAVAHTRECASGRRAK
jgi:hypothetical protein